MLKALEPSVPVVCWSWPVALNESALLCPRCNEIQPPLGGDFFPFSVLKPQLNIDLASLEHEFHRFIRSLHPDRFARVAEDEKLWSCGYGNAE
jgi:hypothetical protein